MACNKHLKFNEHSLYIDTHTYIQYMCTRERKKERVREKEREGEKGGEGKVEGGRQTVKPKFIEDS